ncbi:MAG: hypothetical protein WKG06_45160 [Segetibacter sp.]
MKQSFIKTIQGHQLEFKQVNHAGYIVSLKNVESKGVLYLQKDERGMWNVNETEHLPAWFNEISIQVHFAIKENENQEKNSSSFPQFGYLF